MTEQIQDQVSAFLDDELSPEECAFFVRRLERDPDTRSQLIRYTAIGAALRGELIHAEPGILRRRLHSALSGSTELRSKRSRFDNRFIKPALGVGIAATVAIAAVLVLRSANHAGVAESALQAQTQQGEAAAEAPSYVVPLEANEGPLVTPQIQLTNYLYLLRHGGFASRLSRTSVHSNVVSAGETEIAVEDEEAVE